MVVWTGDGLSPPGAPVPLATGTIGVSDTPIASVLGGVYLDDTGPRPPAILVDQADGVTAHIHWVFPATTSLAFRVYVRLTATAATSWVLIRASETGGATETFRVAVSGTGTSPHARIRITNAAGTQVGQSAGGIPIGAWARLEGVLAAGVLTVKCFDPVDSGTVVAQVSGSVGANVGEIQMGSYGSNNPGLPDMWLDDIVFVDTADWIGPVDVAPALPVTYWDGTQELSVASLTYWDGTVEQPAMIDA